MGDNFITITLDESRVWTLERIEQSAKAFIENAFKLLNKGTYTQRDYDLFIENVNAWVDKHRDYERQKKLFGPQHLIKKIRNLPVIEEQHMSYDQSQDTFNE